MTLDEGKDGKSLNVEIGTIELTNVTAGAVEQKLGTKYDQRDMMRMGKRQELRVRIFPAFICIFILAFY